MDCGCHCKWFGCVWSICFEVSRMLICLLSMKGQTYLSSCAESCLNSIATKHGLFNGLLALERSSVFSLFVTAGFGGGCNDSQFSGFSKLNEALLELLQGVMKLTWASVHLCMCRSWNAAKRTSVLYLLCREHHVKIPSWSTLLRASVQNSVCSSIQLPRGLFRHRAWVMGLGFWVMGLGLWVMGYEL